MKLATLLERDNNNLDIFRLLAACLVIYGHAYAIAPQPGQSDAIGRWLGFDYSGSLAVKVFFFLSGLVVANSLLTKRSVRHFWIGRFFRIWPGLLAVLLLCALVLGPWVSALPVQDYFAQPQTYKYVLRNALMRVDYTLPGVFLANPHPGAVNGSLWSIPHEVAAYIGLLALFMVGVLRSHWLAWAIFAVLLLDPLVGNAWLFTWRAPNAEIDFLLPCFAAGALLALYKDKVQVCGYTALGLVLLYGLLRSSAHAMLFFYAALFATILVLAGQPWLVRWRLPVDVSYGVYLWGFPVQQTLVHLMPDQGTRLNQVVAMAVALVLGWVSWHAVEKHGVAWGRRWQR